MAVTVRRFLERTEGYGLELIAGAAGLDRPIDGIHLVERASISGFIRGDEAAVITGVGLSVGEDLGDLVRSIEEHGASAAIINLGPYIADVPGTVIAFCDEARLPLITAPWSVRIPDLANELADMVAEEDSSDATLATAYREALLRPDRDELYLDVLRGHGCSDASECAVAVLEVVMPVEGGFEPVGEERLGELGNALARPEDGHVRREAVVTLGDALAVVLVGAGDFQQIEAQVSRLLRACEEQLDEGELVYAAFGSTVRGARALGKSYRQARGVAQLQRARGNDGVLCSYDAIGVYKLLLAIEDDAVLENFYDETVGPLEVYDRSRGSDLMRVLVSYLSHSGSVKEAAVELGVHRNTVNYKVRSIERVLDCDLSDFKVRMRLALGLCAREVLASRRASGPGPAAP